MGPTSVFEIDTDSVYTGWINKDFRHKDFNGFWFIEGSA
jgi:hypothetical protein